MYTSTMNARLPTHPTGRSVRSFLNTGINEHCQINMCNDTNSLNPIASTSSHAELPLNSPPSITTRKPVARKEDEQYLHLMHTCCKAAFVRCGSCYQRSTNGKETYACTYCHAVICRPCVEAELREERDCPNGREYQHIKRSLAAASPTDTRILLMKENGIGVGYSITVEEKLASSCSGTKTRRRNTVASLRSGAAEIVAHHLRTKGV